MALIGSIGISTSVDTSGLSKGLASARAKLSSFSAGDLLGGALAGVGVAAAVATVKDLAGQAAHLEEGMNKVDAVFKATSATIRASARGLADEYGIAITEVVDDYGRMGSMLGGAGFDESANAAMTDSLVKLANDLSRFNDTSFEVAFQKVRSGLAGESEPLRDFGIFLTEDAVKAKALAMGMTALGGKLTEAQKIQARANIIFAQAGPAIGAAAREADGTSAKLEALSGRWENLKITIGETFAPGVGSAVGAVNDTLKLLEAAWKTNAMAAEDWGDRAKKAADGVRPGGGLADDWGYGEVATGWLKNMAGVAQLAYQPIGAGVDVAAGLAGEVGTGIARASDKLLGTRQGDVERAGADKQWARLSDRLEGLKHLRWGAEEFSEELNKAKFSAPAIPGKSTGMSDPAGLVAARREMGEAMAGWIKSLPSVGEMADKLRGPEPVVITGYRTIDPADLAKATAESTSSLASLMSRNSAEAASTALRSRYGGGGSKDVAANTKRTADGVGELVKALNKSVEARRDAPVQTFIA